MDLLRVEIYSITENYMSAIPPVVPSFVQPSPLPGPILFDLFVVNDEAFHIVGT